jgi:hypothetical protein
MKKNLMLLALLAISVVLFALPTVASAGEWELDNTDGTFTVTKVTNSAFVFGSTIVTCTGLTGSGTYTSKTTGTITLDYSGCKEGVFGTDCTNAGGAAGTILVNNKVFHNVIIGNAGDINTPIGILITGSSGTELSCGFGLVTVKTTGNVIGEIETPKCGTAGTTYNLNFDSATGSPSTQKYEQVTTTGTKYDMVADIPASSDSTTTSALSARHQLHFTNGAVTPTCS